MRYCLGAVAGELSRRATWHEGSTRRSKKKNFFARVFGLKIDSLDLNSNVCPVAATRVRLRGGSRSDYINANFVTPPNQRVYIATQAPLPGEADRG